eukprot:Em0018g73a
MATPSERVLHELSTLTGQQKYDLLLELLRGTETWQLRKLYSEIAGLLAVDILCQVPPDVAEKILSYLDATSLCAVATCSRGWRQLADNDDIWHRLCINQDYVKFEYLTQQPWVGRSSHAPATPPSHWKHVYAQAHTLDWNWRRGSYVVPPLLKGHRLTVTSIAHDGDLLVSGSRDNTARVWSLQTLECINVLEAHTDSVNDVAVKDGLVATASSDGLVRVFNAKSGQCLRLLQGHMGSVDHIAFDGKIIVSAGADCSIRVWEAQKGRLLHTLTGHSQEIECLLLNGNIAVSGSWDSSIRVWSAPYGVCRLVLTGHTQVVYCSCINPSSTRLVSGGGEGIVRVWNLHNGNQTATLAGHSQEIMCVQCTEDLIASGSADSYVRLWNYTGTCFHILMGHIGYVRCLRFRGNMLVSGGDTRRITVWDSKTGSLLHTVHKQPSLLHCMHTTETQIITASPDAPGTICVVNYW